MSRSKGPGGSWDGRNKSINTHHKYICIPCLFHLTISMLDWKEKYWITEQYTNADCVPFWWYNVNECTVLLILLHKIFECWAKVGDGMNGIRKNLAQLFWHSSDSSDSFESIIPLSPMPQTTSGATVVEEKKKTSKVQQKAPPAVNIQQSPTVRHKSVSTVYRAENVFCGHI